MPRHGRKTQLQPHEQHFRLDVWLEKNAVIEEVSGPEWVISCPKCGREKLAVHVHRKAFQCWRCGFAGWTPTPLVAKLLDVPLARATEIIAAQGIGRPVGEIDPLKSQHQERQGLPPLAALPRVEWTLQPAQWAYIQSRGVSAEMASMLGLGTVVPDFTATLANKTLAGRVLFPVWDNYDRLIFWQARAIDDDSVKTLNLPRSCRQYGHHPECVCEHERWGLVPVPKAATAWEAVVGLHLIKKGEPVVIVEGPIDVAVCGPQFVSPLGAKLSPQQAALIAEREPSEAFILFDGDQGGRKALRKSIDLMSGYVPTRGTTCPPGTDPGDLGREACLAIFQRTTTTASLPTLQPRRKQSAVLDNPIPLLPQLANRW